MVRLGLHRRVASALRVADGHDPDEVIELGGDQAEIGNGMTGHHRVLVRLGPPRMVKPDAYRGGDSGAKLVGVDQRMTAPCPTRLGLVWSNMPSRTPLSLL